MAVPKQQTTPTQPISLRILFTENHQWMKVENHLSVCPGNGCSVDVCLYIRALCSHDIENCLEDCTWCARIQRWLKYHETNCQPKKCPYYQKMCHDTKKKFFKLSVRRRSDHLKDRSPSSSCESNSCSSETHPLADPLSSPHDIANCCDTGGCCHDPLVQYIPGKFSDTMEQIYRRSLQEELPVTESKVNEIVQSRFQLRSALLQHHRFYKEGTHWERIKQLGCGSTGTTYCIRDMESSFWLALKEEHDTQTAVDETYISLQLSTIAQHDPPNIVEFYGASLLPIQSKVQLFLELMPCCLQSYLFNGGPLSVEDCHNYACQLFDALDFLHTKINLVHSDIKPGNLLIDENIQRIKVADFGCAQILEDSHQGYCMRGDAKAGTIHYNPPEHYNEFRCSYALDVWQAGCCIVAMVTGRRPWRSLYLDCTDRQYIGQAHHIQRRQIASGTFVHSAPGFLDFAMRRLIDSCLQIDYRRRPTPRDCLSILAQSDVVSDDCKGAWLAKLEIVPTCLSVLTPPTILVDVYLGSYVQYPYYSMLPGWLGSISCDHHMTYGQILQIIYSTLPVTHLFGTLSIAICNNSPRLIWQISKLDISTSTHTSENLYDLPQPDSYELIDTSKAIVLVIS